MAKRPAPQSDLPPDAAPAKQRRLWGLRLVVLAATAASLGIPQSQLATQPGGRDATSPVSPRART